VSPPLLVLLVLVLLGIDIALFLIVNSTALLRL